MYTDRELTAALDQAVTATAVSTDSIAMDGLFSGRPGDNFRAYAVVTQDFAAAGAATLTIEVIQATNGALTTSVDVLASSTALALADLKAGGKKFELDIPMPKNTKKFLGFRFSVATGPMTAGKITAGFVPGTPSPLDDRPTYWTGRGA